MWRCSLTRRASSYQRLVRRRELFGDSKEKRRERRQELWRDVQKGYFADFHEFRKTGGKRCEAADHLCAKGEAVRFPRISGRSLAGEGVEVPGVTRGCVTLVLVSLRALGMRMCNLYREPFVEEFRNHPNVKIFEVSLVEKLFFRMLRRWMEGNLRKEIPRERHSSFMVYTGRDIAVLKNTLQLGNTIVGHAHLLDQEGLVRWRVHATPTKREIQAMLKCTRQLLDKNTKANR